MRKADFERQVRRSITGGLEELMLMMLLLYPAIHRNSRPVTTEFLQRGNFQDFSYSEG